MDGKKTPVSMKMKKNTCKTPSGTPVMRLPGSPLLKQLGWGTGVNVYLVPRGADNTYKSPWALKKICSKDGIFTARLRHEAEILRKLNHPKIIGYRSFTKTETGDHCLAMELGQNGLQDFIEKRFEEELGSFPAEQILTVARDIAEALDYLHNKVHLLHGDIKSHNVLIIRDFEIAKLCDFGVSLPLNAKGDVDPKSEYVGTECWTPKEVLVGGKVTAKSDIYPYGLTLWEMLALAAPHVDKMNFDTSKIDASFTGTGDDLSGYDDSEYQEALGTRPDLPAYGLSTEHTPIIELFFCCTHEDPEKRPSAQVVVKTIQDMKL